MSYCSGDCKYLEKEKRHVCNKYKKKLTYMKQTGAISFEAHEQCEQCQTDEYIVKLSKERDYWKNEALKQAAENGERKIEKEKFASNLRKTFGLPSSVTKNLV